VNRPVFTVVAGANGSGKSTLTGGSPSDFSQAPLLDPDAIANTIRYLGEHASPIAAGREVLEKINSYLEAKQSFAVETTLSGKNYLRTMIGARKCGFRIVLVYIATEAVEINLRRIANRVLGGGHGVPESDVRRRYTRSLEHLPSAILLSDEVILFDNSSDLGYQLVAAGGEGILEWIEPLPQWALPLKARFV
jgi:predicted ABC-type ATPase